MSPIMETTKNKTAPSRVDFVSPAVNLRHDSDGYTLEVEMPGVAKNGVEITFDDGRLTLIGHRSNTAGRAGKLLHGEIQPYEHRRVFDLDPAIDPERIAATMDQGLLTLRLPKIEAAKPRKIAVA